MKHQIKLEDFDYEVRTILASCHPVKLELVVKLNTMESKFVVTEPIGKATIYDLEFAIDYYNNLISYHVGK